MIRFTQVKNSGREVNINLMPMIDIIFNLLIFFMITAAISTRGINLDLPESDTAEKMPAKSWEIVINENEEIIFNGVQVSAERLRTIFGAERNRPGQEKVETVVLKAYRRVPFEKFIAVMDLARENGFYNLVIATDVKHREE